MHLADAICGVLLCVGACGCARTASDLAAHPSAPHGTTTTATTWYPPTTTTSLTRLPPVQISSTTWSVGGTVWSVGGTVTLRGTNCPYGADAVATASQHLDGNPRAVYPYGEQLTRDPIPPGDGGTWSFPFTVRALIIGPATIVVACQLDGGTVADYPGIPVTISTNYRLQVQPNGTVAPGTRLTVSSVGGGCDAISQANVGL